MSDLPSVRVKTCRECEAPVERRWCGVEPLDAYVFDRARVIRDAVDALSDEDLVTIYAKPEGAWLRYDGPAVLRAALLGALLKGQEGV